VSSYVSVQRFTVAQGSFSSENFAAGVMLILSLENVHVPKSQDSSESSQAIKSINHNVLVVSFKFSKNKAICKHDQECSTTRYPIQ
jgi:hypothetical protein